MAPSSTNTKTPTLATTLTPSKTLTGTPTSSKTLTLSPILTTTISSTPTNLPTETPTQIIYIITITNNVAGYNLFVEVSSLNNGWSTFRNIDYGGTVYIGLPEGKYQVYTRIRTGVTIGHYNSFALTINSNIDWNVDSRNYFDDY